MHGELEPLPRYCRVVYMAASAQCPRSHTITPRRPLRASRNPSLHLAHDPRSVLAWIANDVLACFSMYIAVQRPVIVLCIAYTQKRSIKFVIRGGRRATECLGAFARARCSLITFVRLASRRALLLPPLATPVLLLSYRFFCLPTGPLMPRPSDRDDPAGLAEAPAALGLGDSADPHIQLL